MVSVSSYSQMWLLWGWVIFKRAQTALDAVFTEIGCWYLTKQHTQAPDTVTAADGWRGSEAGLHDQAFLGVIFILTVII
jgi:hypothetical protein